MGGPIMSVEDLLREHKESILKKWFSQVVRTYPDETAKFLQREQDPFNNPVGSNILHGIEEIFDQLASGNDVSAITPFLERVVRIRAIQDFTPSQAVAFVFALKGIVRAALGDSVEERNFARQLTAFEDKVDKFGLLTFDAYMQSREKVYELRANEVKNSVASLLKRANLMSGHSEEEGEQ